MILGADHHLCRRARLGGGVLALVALHVSATQVALSAGDLIKESSGLCRVRAISLAGWGGEENWSSLAVMPDGKALVGLSSRSGSGVLVVVDPDRQRVRCAVNLAEVGHLSSLERQPKIHVTPVRDGQGWYHFLSHFGLDTHLPLLGSRLGYEGMRRWRWHSETGRAEELGLVAPAEGAIALNASADAERLFVVTFPKGRLLVVDGRSGNVHDLGRANATYAPRHVLVDPWDNPYVLDHAGQFWSVTSDDRVLRPVQAKLPVETDVSGNVLAQGLVAAAPIDGRAVWLVTSAWGQLYEICFEGPGQVKVTDHGRPAERLAAAGNRRSGRKLVTASGLAVGPDGEVYLAISGYNRSMDRKGDSYLVRCQRDGTDVRLVARLDGNQASYVCGSNAVDPKRRRVFFAACHLTKDSPSLVVLEGL